MPSYVPFGKKVTLAGGVFPYFRIHPEYHIRVVREVLQGAYKKAARGRGQQLTDVMAYIFEDDENIWNPAEGDTTREKSEKEAIKKSIDSGKLVVAKYGAEARKAIEYIKTAYEKTQEAVRGRTPNPGVFMGGNQAPDIKGEPQKWLNEFSEQLKGLLNNQTAERVREDAFDKHRLYYPDQYPGDPIHKFLNKPGFGPGHLSLSNFISIARGKFRGTRLRKKDKNGELVTTYTRNSLYAADFYYDFLHSRFYQKRFGYPRDADTIAAYELDETMDKTGSTMSALTGDLKEKFGNKYVAASLGTAQTWLDEKLKEAGRDDASGRVNEVTRMGIAGQMRFNIYYAGILAISNNIPLPERTIAENIQRGEWNWAWDTKAVWPAPRMQLFKRPFISFSYFQPPKSTVISVSNGKYWGSIWGGLTTLTLVGVAGGLLLPGYIIPATVTAVGLTYGLVEGINRGDRIFDKLREWGYRTRRSPNKGFLKVGAAIFAGVGVDIVLATLLKGYVPYNISSAYLPSVLAPIPFMAAGLTMAYEFGVLSKKLLKWSTALYFGYALGVDAVLGAERFFAPSADQLLAEKVEKALKDDSELKAVADQITVRTNDGVVELTGRVTISLQKTKAEQDALGVDGVKKINDAALVVNNVPENPATPGSAVPTARTPSSLGGGRDDFRDWLRRERKKERRARRGAELLLHKNSTDFASVEFLPLEFRNAAGEVVKLHLIDGRPVAPTAQVSLPKAAIRSFG